MIFDARKSAENSKQIRETNAATPRPPDAKRSSPDPASAAPDAQTRTANADYLGLRVEREADDWRVTWNRNISVNSVQGRLSLVDGVVHKNLELRSNELQNGTVSYSYAPQTEEVFLRLEITAGESLVPMSQSVRLAADSVPSPLVRSRRRTLPQRERSAAGVSRPRAGKAQESSKDTGAQDFASVRSLMSKPPAESRSIQARPQQGSSAFEPAKLIAGSSPVYPATAQESVASESVEVSFRISPEGKVYNVKWLTGPPSLAQAAMEAVESWLYEPARLNGAPIDSQGNAAVDFKWA